MNFFHRWFARDDTKIDDLIKPPRVLHADFNPDLRERAGKRREIADKIARRAAAVQSGAVSSQVLRMVVK